MQRGGHEIPCSESSVADEYERLAEKAELSYEEALTLKEEVRKRAEPGEFEERGTLLGRWHVILKMNSTQARNFLNATPITPPGEGDGDESSRRECGYLPPVAVVTNQPDRIMNVYCWYRFFIT